MLAFEQCLLAACWELAWSCDSVQVQQFKTWLKNSQARLTGKEGLLGVDGKVELGFGATCFAGWGGSSREWLYGTSSHYDLTSAANKGRTRQGVETVVGRLTAWQKMGRLEVWDSGVLWWIWIARVRCLCCRSRAVPFPQLCSASRGPPINSLLTGFRVGLAGGRKLRGLGEENLWCVSFVVPGPAGVPPAGPAPSPRSRLGGSPFAASQMGGSSFL